LVTQLKNFQQTVKGRLILLDELRFSLLEICLKRVIVVLTVLLSSFSWSAELRGQFSQLRILTEDYPPLNYLEEGRLTGASTEILELVYQKLGFDLPEIEVMPWPRAYHLAQSQDPFMLFTMSRTAAREELFQWAGHTHSSRTYLYTYKGSGIESYDPKVDHSERIVAVQSDVTEAVLLELGYPEDVIDLVDSNETMFRIFKNHRTKLISVSASPLQAFQEREEFQNFPFVRLAITREIPGHFAFSHGVDPEVVAAFQSALDSVREEQKAILKKYGLDY
jgi:polar amino acid transport system substrate-binding protein